MPLPDHYFFQKPQQRPLIGISACLSGEPVRYDGGHKHQPLLNTLLNQYATVKPACPEAGAGFGTPRPAIQLVQTHTHITVQRVHDGEDVSTPLQQWITQTLAAPFTADGFILKIRSPSCGLNSTPVHDANGHIVDYDSGLFAKALQQQSNACVLASEEQLQTDKEIRHFLMRCMLLQESRLSPADPLLAHYRQYFPDLENLAAWQALITDTGNSLVTALTLQVRL